jgi:uncharacterized protein (DUF2249 family)
MSVLPVLSLPWTVDVRSLSKACHTAPLFEAFDRLRPGQAMIAVTDHVPRRFLTHLQTERKGLFEWVPLESGPEVFRTEVVHRAEPLGSLRRIQEALEWDHDRLDALLAALFEARDAKDYERARILVLQFELGLRRHIRFEEEELFPAFETRSGLSRSSGPTGVMRAEHREIEALLEGLVVSAGLPGYGATLLREDLVRRLHWHNQKEEGVLYPHVERALGADESDGLVARFQSL